MGCKQHQDQPPTFSTFFREDMVIKILLGPLQKTDFKIKPEIQEGIFWQWGTKEFKIKEKLRYPIRKPVEDMMVNTL